MHILIVAAENGALRGGKVGGVGDVIRDLPRALQGLGHCVSVITPAYGRLTHDNPSRLLGQINTPFAGGHTEVSLFQYEDAANSGKLRQYLLDHPDFAPCGAGQIYCHDNEAPFATDAHKFALFCAAVAQWLLVMPASQRPDVLHLHDWHSAGIALLRHAHPRYQALQSLRTVFTIHNLALQGIRPWHGDSSSPQHWFPELPLPLEQGSDPRYPWCINLMRCGLRLTDRVHVVSPGYSEEILLPNDPEHGFHGGEGLEADLQWLAAEGRLYGILNGCEYPPAGKQSRLANASGLHRLCELIRLTLLDWSAASPQVPAAHVFALDRVLQWRRRQQGFARSLVFIGRLTEQKVALLLHPMSDARPALAHLLEQLGDAVLVMIGSGEAHYQLQLAELMQRHDNFLFLQGFSEPLADALYAAGDLFLMPSSFEPCGISQMLAMRTGTPCIVHHVGGLRDTVTADVNGFAFTGDTVDGQVKNLFAAVDEALGLMESDHKRWQQMRKAAAAARFEWQGVAQDYVDRLYR